MLALISSLAASQISMLAVVAIFIAALFMLMLGALFSSARRIRFIDRPLAG